MVTSTSATDPRYEALVHGCGLLDRSELGKLALVGEQAREFLAGQVTNDTESLEPGTGCYAALLDNKGKMLGDLRVLRSADGTELLLVCERVALQALFDVLRRAVIGWQAELQKRTIQQGLLSLIGPRAREVAGADAAGLGAEEHVNVTATIEGHPVLLVTTDTGVDVVCEAAAVDAVRDALGARGAVSTDEATAELRRIELGRPRYGVDLDGTVIPQEAGLNERAVSFTKGCYVGQETVARLFYRGKPNRHLRGLRLAAPAERGNELHLPAAPGADEPGRLLGTVTSAAVSPALGPIALAFVRREAQVGDTVVVGTTTGVVTELPF